MNETTIETLAGTVTLPAPVVHRIEFCVNEQGTDEALFLADGSVYYTNADILMQPVASPFGPWVNGVKLSLLLMPGSAWDGFPLNSENGPNSVTFEHPHH